jgi:hypothetical protein
MTDQRGPDTPTSGQEMTEARGSLITADRTLFFTLVKYFSENQLVEAFEEYLEQQNCYEVVLDVAFANHMKRFLIQGKRSDPVAKLALMCDCGGGGGGGSPSGVRG